MSIHTPIIEVFRGLDKAGYQVTSLVASIKENEWGDQDCSCVHHCGGKGHNIEGCWDLKARVEGLITMGVISATRKLDSSKEVNMVERFVLRVPSVDKAPTQGNMWF